MSTYPCGLNMLSLKEDISQGLGFHISLNQDEFQHLAPNYKLPNYKHWLNLLLVLCHKYGTQSATVGTSQLCQYQPNHNEAKLNAAPIASELAHGPVFEIWKSSKSSYVI